jgi:hypothetical protein
MKRLLNSHLTIPIFIAILFIGFLVWVMKADCSSVNKIISPEIFYCEEFPDFGNGYKIDADGQYSEQLINSDNLILVDSVIIDYGFDSDFIILSQRPWGTGSTVGMNYDDTNEAFEKSTFLQYWIVNKKEETASSYDEETKIHSYSNVYGPYSLQEYLQKRQELGVPAELKF